MPANQKWEFYTYDEQWATRGLPFTDNTLPPGIVYICGKPERNRTADGDGNQRQHFQGLVAFSVACTRADLQRALGLENVGAVPVGNSMVHDRIEYTKKEETAVLDADGNDMWREAGKLSDNLKRSGDKYSEILECVKNGGTEKDVLEMHPQIGITNLNNISRMAGIYSKPVDRPDLQVYVIEGATNVGKSHFARRILQVGDNSEMYNKPHPASATAVDYWPANYSGATRVLFDDFHSGRYNITDLLNYFQEYSMSVPFKGGYMAARWNVVVITTNESFDSWYDHLPAKYAANIAALRRRIPPENRMTMYVRPPPEMTKCTFAEMKAYQEQHKPQQPQRAPANQLDLNKLSDAEMRELLTAYLRRP